MEYFEHANQYNWLDVICLNGVAFEISELYGSTKCQISVLWRDAQGNICHYAVIGTMSNLPERDEQTGMVSEQYKTDLWNKYVNWCESKKQS